MAWRRSGDKALSEPTLVKLPKHICVTQRQWVNSIFLVADKPGYDEFIKATDAEYKDRNLEKAKMFYEKACKLGHPMAQSNYALWHLEGE